MRVKTALRGPCWCQEACCPARGRLRLAVLGAGRTAGQAEATASSLRTVEGELEAAQRVDWRKFCQKLGGEKEDETLCCLRQWASAGTWWWREGQRLAGCWAPASVKSRAGIWRLTGTGACSELPRGQREWAGAGSRVPRRDRTGLHRLLWCLWEGEEEAAACLCK